MHFHCSRELGAMLPLNLPFTATVFNVRWLTVNEQQQHYQSMRHEHKAYIRRAQELVQRKMSAGLLQLVVRWGRHEMLRNVLRDPSLVEQRQVQQVQQAFNDALKLSTVPSYDTKVVDVLLDQGARAQEVFAATLFELDGDSLYSDAFGYCAGMSVAAPDEASFRRPSYASSPRLSGESVASASRFSRAIGQVRLMNKAIPLQPKSQMSTKSSPSRRRRLPNSRGLMMMLRIVRMARRNRKRIAASAINVEGWNSPWRNEHVRKLQKFVVGFDGYAVTRHTLDTFDIVLWAILCGAFKLASTLWLRQECESPLRLSLLVQHMCMKIRLKEKKRINELQETEDFFNRYAIKLLDNIPDQETARKLLLSTASPKATLGAPKDIRLSLLDLAIDLRNVQFISHRHCQAVIDDIWKGRSPDCGKVQLATLPQNHLIFLQIPAAACFIQLLRLKTNDLYEWPADRIVDGQVLVSPAEALTDLFKIPLVKRQVALVSQLVFTIFSTVMFFLPLCGEVGAHHVIYTIWVFANMLAEGHQYSNSSTKWRHNFFNKVDFIVLFLLFIATVLRFVLIDVDGVIHDRIPSLDFADWLNQIYHPSAGELRPSWYQTKVPPTLRNSDCPWSIEMEILRTLLGLAIFLLLFRMLEFMAFHYDIGVLMVCAECMISDLAKWLPLMLTVTMGAALGFNILAPNYHLEDAPGPFHLIPSLSLDLSVGGPFMATFWALFGFYDPAALALGQGTTMLAPLFMWVYLMISVILFVNLLIAMFSDSYSAISKNSDAEWWMSRVLKIKTYMALDPIPTPLNFPVKLYCVVRDLLCSRKGPDKDEDRKGDPIDASGPAAMAQSVLANRLRPSCRRSSTNFYKPRQPPSLLCTASSDNTTIGTFKKTDSTDELTRGDHGKRESHYGGPLNSLFSARDAEVVEATAREKLLVSHIAEERVRNRQVEALDRLQSEMQDADVAISECRNAVVSLQHQVTKLDERLSIAFGDEPTSTRSPSSGKAYRLKGRTATFRRLKEDGDTLPDSDLRSQMSELLSVVKGLAAAPHLSAKRSQQHSSKVDSKVAQAIALASDAGPPAGLLQTPVHRAPPAIPNSESSKDPKASLPFGQPPQLRTLSTPPELQHVCDQASPNSQSSTCKKPPKPITKQATFVPYGKSAVKQPHLALPRAAEPPGASPSVLPEATAPPAASPFVLPQAAAPPAAPPSVLPQEAEPPATESRRIESDSPLARAIEMRMQGVQRGKSSKLRTGWT
ncbi:hypothetical protein AB1Y20_022381 [Prymnesium parvum]|uniref:Ion transport domain-containing protein n=1 Tax=Prymnesium parvum TaxID=97485 RepID=A0AB34JGX4_PRYPA